MRALRYSAAPSIWTTWTPNLSARTPAAAPLGFAEMAFTTVFQVTADARAKAWLAAHPSDGPRVIAYEVHRCCGGGRICNVVVRTSSDHDAHSDYAPALLEDGTRILVDPRAAARLPARFGLTVRGLGPLKHLDLELHSEQWGELLYA
jgi:hypothetical protein